MDDKVLVIRVNSVVSSKRLHLIQKSIIAQIQAGVVILPFGCEVLVVPKDIEIKVESAPEAFTKNCNTCNWNREDWEGEYHCTGTNVSMEDINNVITGKKECRCYIEEVK